MSKKAISLTPIKVTFEISREDVIAPLPTPSSPEMEQLMADIQEDAELRIVFGMPEHAIKFRRDGIRFHRALQVIGVKSGWDLGR